MNLLDAANRGLVAGALGAPVDLSTGVVNAGLMGAGYLGNKLGLLSADQMPQPIGKPVLGSEWLGDRMQDAGMVSADRQPLAEFMASLAAPGVGVAKAPALLDKVSPLIGFMGAMSKEGKARLLADLQARLGSGRYKLGDVTEGQGQGLDKLFGREAGSRDVHMTDDALGHIVDRRMDAGDGFRPEEVVKFAEDAMARRARPDLDVAKGQQNPALLGPGVDPATRRPYTARMPLKSVDDGYEVRTVIPEGVKRRNMKASD